jgi:hypothetical protein
MMFVAVTPGKEAHHISFTGGDGMFLPVLLFPCRTGQKLCEKNLRDFGREKRLVLGDRFDCGQ